MKRVLLSTAFVVASLLSFAQQSLTPELLWKFARVSEPRVSPDGRYVLCSVRRIDYVASRGNTDIWKFDLSNGQSSAIAADSSNESSARWSSDGSVIYFSNDASGSSQVWVMNPDGTGKKQLTHLGSDVNGFAVAPAGNRMWLTMDVKVKEFNGKEMYKDLPKTSGRI
ncbi:MAG: TolB family protein, partial [Bacteroidota bacterium]